MCQENEDTIITSSTTELDIEAEYNKEITTAKPTKIQELYRRASMGDGYCARKPGSVKGFIDISCTYKTIKELSYEI